MLSAKPPEHLEEIFPRTQLIIDAEVVEVKSHGPQTPKDAYATPSQVVVLKVKRVIRGKLLSQVEQGTLLTVTKPEAPYTLVAGNKGPWLIHQDEKSGALEILGRYGPDSWTFERIDEKLQALKPAHLAK